EAAPDDSMTLTSSSGTSVFGQVVTFTATVGPVAPAGGAVQFQLDGNNVGDPVILAGGQASFNATGLSVDRHTITASYSGYVGFSASSATTTQTVVPFTLTNVQAVLQAAAGSTIPVVIQVSASADATTIVSAVNALAPTPSLPETVEMDLG